MMVYSDHDGYWISNDPSLSFYQVYAPRGTHSIRIASVGKNYGLQRAVEYIVKHKLKHNVART